MSVEILNSEAENRRERKGIKGRRNKIRGSSLTQYLAPVDCTVEQCGLCISVGRIKEKLMRSRRAKTSNNGRMNNHVKVDGQLY